MPPKNNQRRRSQATGSVKETVKETTIVKETVKETVKLPAKETVKRPTRWWRIIFFIFIALLLFGGGVLFGHYVFPSITVSICHPLYPLSRSPVDNGIISLCAKGVYANDTEFQNREFRFLRNPSSAPLHRQSDFTSAQARLLHLYGQAEENYTNTLPPSLHTFSQSEFPYYDVNNVYFLKYPQKLVQRHQLTGLCYMHAPAVVQHYKLNTTNSPMIDILAAIRDHFTAEQLAKHIFEKEGGSSLSFLEQILERNSEIVSNDDISKNFDAYGVGLVSGFRVYDDFADGNVRHHYGRPRGNFRGGLHAMALVGHRHDGVTQFYLLQNWWASKQFVELDADYLKHSRASVHFIETPQTTIPSDWQRNYGKFFEAELIDKPERHAYEC